MFGSKGFSNPLGDDILNSFIQDTAKRSQTSKPLTESDEKHLLATKKLVQQLEDEEINKSPTIKTTTSLAQSNLTKKKSSEPKPNNDIDDLLDFIDDVKGEKPSTKKPTESAKTIQSPPKATTIPKPASTAKQTVSTVSNKFAEELSDDELDMPAYDPTARNTTNKRPALGTQDLSKKKEALFGLSNSAFTNMNKTQSSDLQNSNLQEKPQQRPQTMETKAKKDDDDIGEINIGFSRRKTQGSAGKKKSTEEQKPPQDNKTLSLSPGRPSNESKVGDWGHKDTELDEEEEESKYLSSFLNKDKKDQKNTLAGSRLGDKGSVGRIGTITNTAEITTPVKSPRSEFTISKEGFFPNKELHLPPPAINEKKEDNSVRNPIGILGKKELLNPFEQHQQQQQQQSQPQPQPQLLGKSITNLGNSAVRKERIDGFGSRPDNLQTSGVSAISGEAMSIQQGLGIHGAPKDVNLQGYLKETEEYYKKRAKESEEYYENRYKQLKKAMEEEKAKWEEIHEKELKLVKKENEDLKEHMNKHLERERERMKEMFELEMQSKEKIHSYELQRQMRQFEEENYSLKKQLDAQAKLNSLADEIKSSSNKLISLSDKMEQGKGEGKLGVKGELREKEKQVEEMEKKLRHELEMVNDERKRLDKIRIEMDNRDKEERESLEKEKSLLRQEYARLNELQDSIRKQEVDKMRNLEKEKVLYHMEREKIEREALRTKEEYSKKYHDLEVQTELYNIKKKEFDRILDQTEMNFMKKQEEMEAAMKRLSAIEVDLMGRVKELEHKEMMVKKSADEVQRRLDLLELDRITFEKERSQVIKMADKTREDNEKMNRFRHDFEDEQQKNVLLRTELAAFAASLNNERNQLAEERTNFANMSKALEAIKYDYVKEIGLGQRNILTETNRPPKHTRERSQDSPFEKAPYSYVSPPGTAWNSAQKNTRERENKYDGGSSLQGAVFPPNDRLVRLKDLRDGINEPRGLSDLKKADENKAFKKAMYNSDGFQNWAKSTSYTEAKPQIAEKFDYNNYMAQLKAFDRTSNMNKSYIEMEREELMLKKTSPSSTFSPKKPYSLAARSRSEKLSPM